MKNYETPRAELCELPLQDVLTTSTLGDQYSAGGTDIDKIYWTDLFGGSES